MAPYKRSSRSGFLNSTPRNVTMPTIRRALTLALASHAFTHPVDPPVPVIVGPPDSQIFPCTATLEVPPQPCPTEQPKACAATETLFSEVDCGGCLGVTVRTVSGHPCPTPTGPVETVDGTTTEWETVCSPTTALPIFRTYDELHRRQEAPIIRTACPTTLIIPVEGFGAVETVFERWVTETSLVPCGSCDLVTSTMVGGLGAILAPGTTATEQVGTSTTYACEG